MSWEGELSDQEVSQMDQELPAGPSLNVCPSASETSATQGVGPSPPQQPPPPLPAQTTMMAALKTEPIHEEEAEEELDEDEHEMEGIQSAGPGSPQPMCTNAGEEENEADCRGQHPQHLVMPPPSLSFHHHHQQQQQHHVPPTTTEIKTEPSWNAAECGAGLLKAEPSGCIRPSPPLTSSSGSSATVSVVSSVNTTTANVCNSGSTPSAVPRPTFSDAFTGHTPLASPLTSRHPIRLPLSAVSGKTNKKFFFISFYLSRTLFCLFVCFVASVF